MRTGTAQLPLLATLPESKRPGVWRAVGAHEPDVFVARTVVTDRSPARMGEAGLHPSNPGTRIRLTRHARQRMSGRRLPEAGVRAALEHGRVVHLRGAAIHAIGRKEVSRCGRRGIDISRYEGIQVVCTPGGTILTVYRNRDFRGLRPRRRPRRRRQRSRQRSRRQRSRRQRSRP